MVFRDRTEGGKILANELLKYKNDENVVLVVPRGGVPVAYEVAKKLNFPIDLVLTKKIGHPLNKDYAIGAATISDYFIYTHEEIDQAYVEKELNIIRRSLRDVYKRFMGNQTPPVLEGKTLLIIDEGIATGKTLLATVNMLRKSKPERIVIGVPVSSKSAFIKLAKTVDEMISIVVPKEFYGVGAFYADFEKVTDERVIYYLNKLKQMRTVR